MLSYSLLLRRRLPTATPIFWLIVLCLCLFKTELMAISKFYQKRSEGWHWYEERPIYEEDISQKEQFLSPIPLTPTKQIEVFKKDLETRLHTALVSPTQENIRNYLTLQKQWMDHVQKFALTWQRTVLTTPELDETLKSPVNQTAVHVFLEEETKRKTKKIRDMAEHYGLIFFFRSGCPYCKVFAKTVREFADTYGWKVLAVFLDQEGALPEFPDAQMDNGIARNLNIEVVPTLLALHPQTKRVIPLSFGVVSARELEERIDILQQGESE